MISLFVKPNLNFSLVCYIPGIWQGSYNASLSNLNFLLVYYIPSIWQGSYNLYKDKPLCHSLSCGIWISYLSIISQAYDRSATISMVISTSSLILIVLIIWWRYLRVSARNCLTCKLLSNWWNSWTWEEYIWLASY